MGSAPSSPFRRCISSQEEGKAEGRLSVSNPPLMEKNQRKIPKYKSVSRNGCRLLKLLWERDWPNALQRVASNPTEACCVTDSSGRTALHLASFNHGCPMYVARALVDANPHALWVQDTNKGYTPLHYACAFKGGTDHLVPLFCQHLEQMGERYEGAQPHLQSSHSSPLLLACQRNAPVSVIAALLTTADGSDLNKWIAPETGAEPYWQPTRTSTPASHHVFPLFALFSHFDIGLEAALRLDRTYLEELLQLETYTETRLDEHTESDSDENAAVLRKAMMLISTSTSRIQGYSGGTLHLVCATKVPVLPLVKIVGNVMPEDAMREDSFGYIPLHHAVIHPDKPLELLQELLAINSDSSRICIPESQSYPLHAALQRGWNWDTGIAEIVAAHPEALAITDPGTGLLPFLLAASVDTSVSTIFELLRALPHLSLSTGSYQ